MFVAPAAAEAHSSIEANKLDSGSFVRHSVSSTGHIGHLSLTVSSLKALSGLVDK